MTLHWIAVASAEPVRIGRGSGFMQVCHGKVGPLRRILPGDWVAYYSPTDVFRGPGRLQSFTAIGRVREGAPYQADMGEGFRPFRRDVEWLTADTASIGPLLGQLSFSRGRKSWGYMLRFGVFEVPVADMAVIAAAMRADQSPDVSRGAAIRLATA